MSAPSEDPERNLSSAKKTRKGTKGSHVNLSKDGGADAIKTKSTGSLKKTAKQAIDSATARNIVRRCMSDMDRVRLYLERELADVDQGIETDMDEGHSPG
ncbi:hypothetical protein JTB14_034505 [Gonioctena quinquepunctata]|nr:hypothetical protein JTB14_034505 [Gonioctena quinquepunctata]